MRSSTSFLKIIFVLFLFGLVPIYAQESESLKTDLGAQNFDYNWKFSLGDHPKAVSKDFDDSSWKNLVLPHDWSVSLPIKNENPSAGAGGFFENGFGWYRKEFIVPKTLNDKKLSIHFGGVYMNSEVFINGRSLGVHPYGYTPFSYDLTPFLKYGANNIIAVKVDNSQQINSRWFSGSGIYRHVYLKVKNLIHFEDEGTFITTVSAEKDKAEVQIRSGLLNESLSASQLDFSIVIKKDGKQIFSKQGIIDIKPGERRIIAEKIEVENPEFWSPDHPNLYLAELSISTEGKILDSITEDFGIRTISYNAKNGFVLNGKSILINGGNVHHDNGALGAAAFDRAEVRKVQLLKNAGFNAVRTAHNPPSKAFLDACDSIGLLVVDEIFDGWRTEKNSHDYAKYFDNWYKKDTQAMVKRDRNHPSIVFWSIGNEIIERKDPEAVKTARLLKDAVLELDTTRPVTSAMTTWDSDWEVFDPLFKVHDIGGYNYQLHRAESDHQRVPSRIILQTESYPKDAFFCWNMTDSHSYIIGDFVWTAMDYLGESGIGRYVYPGEPEGEHWSGNLFPWHGAYCGDIDLLGWRKPISHYRSMLWNSDEGIYMAVKEPNPKEGDIKLTMWAVWPTWESWTWPGYEEKELEVEVYTKNKNVKLFLNGRFLEEKEISRETEYKAVFMVPYQPGKLVAKAYNDGKERASFNLTTAGNVEKIKLLPEQDMVLANAQDLVYVNVELQDKNGVINPVSDQEISFEVIGPAEIIAVDNANLKNSDPYNSKTRKTWNGKALVIIRSTRESGTISLTAKGRGLPNANIQIKSIEND